MKRNIAIVFFIGGFLAVTSSDKIKEAYHDTFNENELNVLFSNEFKTIMIQEK
ncbi:hypothetical protein [Weeksella virosa]|uniref:Uncharacterized protein n=1 Tax=Weeksella virosa (strain ATCC 43766 / DSM 16922 / JCM 21250 / CCUG 30538 / CDC 9751 / IAM 14551 / NBRC 16016 / NCTC 11634 / CL345/78) TaxID=865938 RepID=F0P2G0_WEEVC|nr:hypothetical protein [Weeksella virosa]ADX66772.1 hypothetical protein Weevi_0044 [Weeksella virosa DSM 16922]MDK7374772.1 hypothetical protein [Weeksella virosa]MDK7675138.1 hypothetical protein [Weeksella virosa]SUP53065.1 Uncharacterised protein [Weeksella virosa]VEH63505.1 Uncharacterised protein [Weeksella virosa]